MGVVYFSIIPTFEPSRYYKCWIVCFYYKSLAETAKNAGDVHFQVGQKVRQTIKELGGTMPEDLPIPQKSIKQIEREEAKRLETTD